MTPQALIKMCNQKGIEVHLIDGAVKLKGEPGQVEKAVALLRPHKNAVLAHLKELQAHEAPIDLVAEFMEVDGLTHDDAVALAAVSVQPRPPGEWLAMIAELDMLVERYVSVFKLSDEVRARILDARRRQSLASIPLALAWFKNQLNDGNKQVEIAPGGRIKRVADSVPKPELFRTKP